MKDDTWLDPETGLRWTLIPHVSAGQTYLDAASGCSTRRSNQNYTDWRMPTIDELKTLVKGCGHFKPGGSCKVSNRCRAVTCVEGNSCGCGGDPRKSPSSEGCYGPPEMVGSCASFWSSSQATGSGLTGINTRFWIVEFKNGKIRDANARSSGEKHQVRCVRGKFESRCLEICKGRHCGTVNQCNCGDCAYGYACSPLGKCEKKPCKPSCVRPDGRMKICGDDGCGGRCGTGWAEKNGYACVDNGCCHVFLPGCFDGCPPDKCCVGKKAP